jgi:hypothetical protein
METPLPQRARIVVVPSVNTRSPAFNVSFFFVQYTRSPTR